MDKLTIQHLALYLPYAVKMSSHGRIYTMTGFILESAISVQDKPILRPISDLTKEIDHKGCKIVPIDYISTSIKDSQTTIRRVANNQDMDVLEFWKIQRLLEMHFDVFGLIEKGLAVDINKLESEVQDELSKSDKGVKNDQ